MLVLFWRRQKLFIHNYLRCCKIPKGYSSNSSNISHFVNIVEVTSTQHYIRLVQNWFPEQKMFENDRKELASKKVTSIWHRNGIEKSTWKADRNFVYFESRIHVEISTSNWCHSFQVDSPIKIDEISTKFPRRISIPSWGRIDKDVSIGLTCEYYKNLKNCIFSIKFSWIIYVNYFFFTIS